MIPTYPARTIHPTRRVSTGQTVWPAGTLAQCYDGTDPNGDPCVVATVDKIEFRWLDKPAVEIIEDQCFPLNNPSPE